VRAAGRLLMLMSAIRGVTGAEDDVYLIRQLDVSRLKIASRLLGR
jgi:hypothetical protein